jgi:hypothetical protein
MVLERLSPTTALASLDYKVADLQRRLNKLRFRTQRKVDYLEVLVDTLKKVEEESKRAEAVHLSKSEKRKRHLENEIHKVTLKVMEAEMIKTKLTNILDMLKKEKLGNAAAFDELEDFITEQNGEVCQLHKDYDEALMYKDDLRMEMKQVEDGLQQESKERVSKVMDIKKELREKREIFTAIISQHSDGPVSRPRDGGDETASGDDAASGFGSIVEEVQEEHGIHGDATINVNQFEDAFSKMARSAGVSEVEEVIDRFKTQNTTNKVLEEQSDKAEMDIRDMGVLKEELEKEFTHTKFLGQDDDVATIHRLETMGENIEQNEAKVETNLAKIASLSHKQAVLHSCFKAIAVVLTGQEHAELSAEALVHFCMDQIERLFAERLEGKDIRQLQSTIDEIGFRGDQGEEDDVFAMAEENRRKRKEKEEQDAVDEEEVNRPLTIIMYIVRFRPVWPCEDRLTCC